VLTAELGRVLGPGFCLTLYSHVSPFLLHIWHGCCWSHLTYNSISTKSTHKKKFISV
jgi:hypothetical protein